MSSENEERRFGEHVQQEALRQRKHQKKSQLKEAIERANEELSKAEFYRVGCILRDMVLPLIHELDFVEPWPEYHRRFQGDDEFPWYWSELNRFRKDSDKYLQRVATGRTSGADEFTATLQGQRTGYEEAKQVIRRALVSLESVTSHHEITQHGLTNRADVVGFSTKLGEHLQDWEMDLGDPVRGNSTQAGALKTLFAGGTGNGKSTGAEREFEDFYQRNFAEGRSFKCVDLAGMRDGENWFYDIPQKQKPLRRIREEQGLPADFTESDDVQRPDIEILVPLSPGITNQKLPFDTEQERFTVQPFVVPASGLRKTVLVSFIASRLSEGQEETIRSAYEAVNRRLDDWSLRDLAEEIKDRDELPPKNKATAVNVLRSLQDKGFIRTRDHERALDWRRIFTDTETITVFSQALCEDKVAKYTTFAYLLDAIAEQRKQMTGLPQCAVLCRELWKIAPHSRRQSAFAEVAALQEAIAQMFSELFRENRHAGVHVIADTQAPSDLHKSVREMFNRYVIYSATRDTVKEIFEWTQSDRYQSFLRTMSPKSGEAGIVGQVQPAIDNRDIEFISPVQFVPPSFHHRISPGDDIGMTPDRTGWTARCRHLDHEEACRPSSTLEDVWDDELPAELEIDAVERSRDSADPEDAPVNSFAQQALVESSIDEFVMKRDVYDAFNEFLRKHDKEPWDFDTQQRTTMFGERVKGAIESIKTRQRKGEMAYAGVELTNFGQSLLEDTRMEVESSASVIDDR